MGQDRSTATGEHAGGEPKDGQLKPSLNEDLSAVISDLDGPTRLSRYIILSSVLGAALVIGIIFAAMGDNLLWWEVLYILTFTAALIFALSLGHWHRSRVLSNRLRHNAHALAEIQDKLTRTSDEADKLRDLLVDAVDSVDEGFILFDRDNRLVVCNQRYRKAYPLISDLLVPGASFADILRHAAARSGALNALDGDHLTQWVDDRLYRHLRSSHAQECQLADGRWYRIAERPTRAGGIVKILSDITAAKQHEKELAHKTDVLESTFDAMAQGVAVFDNEHRLLTWNDHLSTVMDYPAHLLQVGTPCEDFYAFDTKRGIAPIYCCQNTPCTGDCAALASVPPTETAADLPQKPSLPPQREPSGPGMNAPEADNENADNKENLKNGGTEWTLPGGRHVEVNMSPMPRGGAVLTFSDVTSRRQTESALQHAQKMDAVGQLAGGIAHEFNNMLTSIGGFARMALRSPDDQSRVIMCLGEVTKAADRAASLTSQLLNFSRRSMGEERRPVHLKDMIKDLTNFLRPLLGERVDVYVEIKEPDLVVAADAARLHQAIVNLCINARDAMPDGGDISLVLEKVAGETLIDRHPALNENLSYAKLVVTDTGTGIDPGHLGRIFEPFFTTKEQGKGTGLGLPMVYSTVEHANGAVEVHSELSQGSCFTLYLPLLGAKQDQEDAQASALEFDGYDLTILLAEDEDSVRRFITMTLEEFDCTVLTATNGSEAVAIYKDAQDIIDLVISDVVMPTMDGPTLTQTLLAENPDLKVILMSGYSPTDDWKPLTEGPGRAFLSKPVDPDTLITTIQKLCHAEQEAS